MLLKFIVFFFNIFYVLANNNAPYLLIEEAKIKSDSQTVNVNTDSNLGFCGCDTTTNFCNNYCCCDPDCSQSVIDLWKSRKVPQCIYTINANMYCLASNLVYTINRRRGMKLITDPDLTQGEICVEVDKLTTTSNNIKEISSLSEADAARIAISKSSSQAELRGSGIVSSNKQIFYRFDMPIYAVHGLLTELATIYYPTPDQYGFCRHNIPIRYQVDVPLQKCTRRTILRNVCKSLSVLSVFRYTGDFKIGSNPNLTLADIPFRINKRYVIDQATGKTTFWNSNLSSPFLEELNATHCNCHNVMKGVNYYFSVWNSTVLEARVDLYFSENYIDFCDKETLIDQAFSIKFGNQLGYLHSGYPGYLIGSMLLAGYSIRYTAGRAIAQDKKGFYLRGRTIDGKCSREDDPSSQFNPFLHETLKFPQSVLTTCSIDLDLAGLQTICSLKEFQKIQIFQNFNESFFVGQYGNADYHFLSDWVGLTYENPLNESDFTWNETNSTCTMPDKELVTIYYKSSGIFSRKQFYVAKVIKTYRKARALKLKTNQGSVQSFTFASDVLFINIDNDDLSTKTRDPPGFFPEIPKDFFTPIWFDFSVKLDAAIQIAFVLSAALLIFFT